MLDVFAGPTEQLLRTITKHGQLIFGSLHDFDTKPSSKLTVGDQFNMNSDWARVISGCSFDLGSSLVEACRMRARQRLARPSMLMAPNRGHKLWPHTRQVPAW